MDMAKLLGRTEGVCKLLEMLLTVLGDVVQTAGMQGPGHQHPEPGFGSAVSLCVKQ